MLHVGLGAFFQDGQGVVVQRPASEGVGDVEDVVSVFGKGFQDLVEECIGLVLFAVADVDVDQVDP